jgi:flavodoxin
MTPRENMRACVIFDTLYGNTEKIAGALVAGLNEAGIKTDCTDVKDVSIDSLNQYDLLCVGGPTQYRTASRVIQDFMGSLAKVDLAGKPAFAFDTIRDSFLAGSAAKYIEEGLRKQGMRIVSQRMSAIIVSPEPEKGKQDFESKDEWKEWRHENECLREGEEKKFEQVGVQIGKVLLRGGPPRE